MAAPRTDAEIREVNERYHDVAAGTYDAKWGIDFGSVGLAQVRAKLEKALGAPLDRPIGRSLEIGAGTGYVSLNLLRAGVVEAAVCTDIASGMLAALEANADRLGLDVETAVADAGALPFPDGSFDLVLGHAVLHHLPDLGAAFGELHRVLRPGGRIAFAGEPSRTGDRIAGVPKRGARAVAPLWRLAVGASPAPAPHADGSGTQEDHDLERFVDIHAFEPGISPPWRARPASRTSASAARSCWPTGSAGPTACSRAAPRPTTCRGCGASTPTAATSPFRRSTAACSSPGCRRRSSTTCCSARGDRSSGSRPPPDQG